MININTSTVVLTSGDLRIVQQGGAFYIECWDDNSSDYLEVVGEHDTTSLESAKEAITRLRASGW